MDKLKSLADRDHSPVPVEWAVRCPSCGYDLTGLTTRYCPECDTAFDPVYLTHKGRRYPGRIELPRWLCEYWQFIFCLPIGGCILWESVGSVPISGWIFWAYIVGYFTAIAFWVYWKFLRRGAF